MSDTAVAVTVAAFGAAEPAPEPGPALPLPEPEAPLVSGSNVYCSRCGAVIGWALYDGCTRLLIVGALELVRAFGRCQHCGAAFWWGK